MDLDPQALQQQLVIVQHALTAAQTRLASLEATHDSPVHINAEAALEQSEQRYRQLIETTHDGIWTIDLEGLTTFVNTTMASLLGYTREEMIGLSIYAFLEPNGYRTITAMWDSIGTLGIYKTEWHMRCKNEQRRWMLAHLSPMVNSSGRVIGALGMIRDITLPKEQEEALAHRERDLDTLLYITSHDLREPLRAIQSFAQIIDERYRDRLDSKGQDFLKRIIRAGQRMDRLMDGILQLSRAQRQITPREHLNAEVLIHDALSQLHTNIVATNAILVVNTPLPTLFVDHTWAVQAIYHLIANALKFTQPNQAPQIEIDAYIPPVGATKGAGIVVRDRGTGLSSEHTTRIFGLFQRAVGREIDGTGTGLAIVQAVADRHGGRVWAQPRAGGGAEFFLTFGLEQH